MGTEIKHLSKAFGSYEALKSVNLTIDDGEFIAILGPSGCGKTTLLRLIAGFDSPTSGQIVINGECVGASNMLIPPEKRNIGMVFQSFALWPHMSVREHIRFPLLHHRFIEEHLRQYMDKRIDEVLEMVELKSLENRMPSELSGGQKQRVAFARAIAPKPALLLMDEPLSSLDAELRLSMRREIQRLHRLTGATIVYVTHDQGEALAMADRIVVMNKGTIEQVGTPIDIYSFPETEFVATFVGKANLIHGEWLDTRTFIPSEGHGKIKWIGTNISPILQKKGLYPVRPEQLKISSQGEGIKATIKNVQYQGKEIHYTLQVGNDEWTVHEDIFTSYSIGDHVVINMRDSQTASVASNMEFVIS